jgi:hypothetical protein
MRAAPFASPMNARDTALLITAFAVLCDVETKVALLFPSLFEPVRAVETPVRLDSTVMVFAVRLLSSEAD